MVLGGLEVISYTTLFMPLTLFTILFDILSKKSLEDYNNQLSYHRLM